MNISSTNNVTATLGRLSNANSTTKPVVPVDTSEQTLVVNNVQEGLSDKPSPRGFVINEQAIVKFKENQLSQRDTSQFSNNQYATTSPDQPSSKNLTAITQYQAINNLAERESVQKIFGVDLLA